METGFTPTSLSRLRFRRSSEPLVLRLKNANDVLAVTEESPTLPLSFCELVVLMV